MSRQHAAWTAEINPPNQLMNALAACDRACVRAPRLWGGVCWAVGTILARQPIPVLLTEDHPHLLGAIEQFALNNDPV